jgi:Tfp pilus assembly protein PilN
MSQQVNLFNTLTPPSKYALTESLILQILGGFILLLAAVTLIQIFLMQQAKSHLSVLQKSYADDQAVLAKVIHLASTVNNEKIIKEIQDKTRLLQVLQARKVTSEQCTLLSNYFTALAETPLPGIWFNQIYINLVNDQMTLAGMTHSPGLLMQLVQNLDKRPCFSSREFGPLKLGNRAAPAKDKLFHFTLNSKSLPLSADSAS